MEFYFSEQMMWAMIAALVLMCFDVATGFIGAWKNKCIDSSKMREGIFHKGSLVMLVALAWCLETFVMHVPDLGVSVPLVIPACVAIVLMELISVTENLVEINPELRESKLLDLFKLEK